MNREQFLEFYLVLTIINRAIAFYIKSIESNHFIQYYMDTLFSFYPDRKTYDEPDERTPEQIQLRQEEEEKQYRLMENGYLGGIVGLLFQMMFDKSRREEVIRLCNLVLEGPPNGNHHCIAYYVLAGLEIPYENYDKAIEILKKGYKTDPFDGFICRGLYYIYYHLKEYDKALEIALGEYSSYRLDIADDGTVIHDCPLCSQIGLCYGMKEDFTTALEWFTKALTDDNTYEGQFAETYYQIGLCWQRMGDEYRARAAYNKSIEIDPKFPEVYNNLASLAYNENGQIQEAIGWLKTALERIEEEHPVEFTIWQNLKMLYNKIADYDNAEYAKYRMLCCVGFGPLLRDPSLPDDESEEEDLDGMESDTDDLGIDDQGLPDDDDEDMTLESM